VEFEIDGNIHYGWIHYIGFGVADQYGLPPSAHIPGGWIEAWAYNTVPGEPIFAGQIPEPSTLVLMIFGAIGIWGLRRRRAC
jgi:hypothetical protein